MIWLLDVSALAAYLIDVHVHYFRVRRWRVGRSLALCPITELGFLRVACASGSTMDDARRTLQAFIDAESPLFVPCDLRALACPGVSSARKTTDIYLSELAAVRGWRFATLDAGINHPAADLIPDLPTVDSPELSP